VDPFPDQPTRGIKQCRRSFVAGSFEGEDHRQNVDAYFASAAFGDADGRSRSARS
jgi:hypothetical protein